MLLETSTVTQTKPVRIVIADDHPFLVDGFCFAMKKHPHVLMAGQAGNGEELIKLVEEVCPDVVFTDIQMPEMDGITATREIVHRFPYVSVIAFTSFIDDCLITDMMEAGAVGYLLKNEHITIILRAIEKVMNRETYYSHEVSNRLVAMMKRTAYNPMKPFDKPRFTELELAVIKEICDELSSKEIATKLGVEVRSVESAKSRIMERTGCRNSAGIVKYAIRNYIVRL
jgi:two-component system, NarL family, response regulator NreC